MERSRERHDGQVQKSFHPDWIGIVVAWNRGYIGFGWLKATASVLLAVFLWFLVLLGVNVHVH